MKEQIIKIIEQHKDILYKKGEFILTHSWVVKVANELEQAINLEVEKRIADKMVAEKCKNCKYRGLPDSINEALNSGDGVYRP